LFKLRKKIKMEAGGSSKGSKELRGSKPRWVREFQKILENYWMNFWNFLSVFNLVEHS